MGAIQCGYCTPAQILAAKELLGRNPDPSEDEVREALSGVLCRCTGYVKPVKAVLRAAAVLRGEVSRASEVGWPRPGEGGGLTQFVLEPPAAVEMPMVAVQALPKIVLTPQTLPFHSVGKPEVKVDAVKLAQGKPAFTADMEMRGMLYAKVLHSPLAHARIRHIETTRAKALPGVAAVLTWQDIPRVIYSTAGQSDPIPGPLDSFSLDNKVRFIGDRVAFVAAESVEIAEEALKLIEVEYEPLPAVFDPIEVARDAPLGGYGCRAGSNQALRSCMMNRNTSILRIRMPHETWQLKSASILETWKKVLRKPIRFLKRIIPCPRCSKHISSRT